MNPPSPQLLRALRTSISYRPTLRSRPSILLTSRLPLCPTPTPLSHLSPRRYNSSETRSSRMVPRAHTNKPTSADRGPADENQTDIDSLNVLGTAPPPTTAIDACLGTGFQFNNGIEVRNGDGVLLVGGEAFAWRPWLSGSTDAGSGPGTKTDEAKAGMVNRRGQFDVDELVWGLLDVVWPRPDLLLVGTGASILPLSLDTKRHINSHGVRVEVLDTRNAAAQFNLLATERGVSEIAAALIPIGWSGR